MCMGQVLLAVHTHDLEVLHILVLEMARGTLVLELVHIHMKVALQWCHNQKQFDMVLDDVACKVLVHDV